MKRLGLCAIAALLIAAPAMAADKLVVETSKKCSFTITLRPDLAPAHVAQVSKLAAAGREATTQRTLVRNTLETASVEAPFGRTSAGWAADRCRSTGAPVSIA